MNASPENLETAPLTVTALRDEAALQALRPAWQSLEDRATEFGLYVTWDYVQLAWQHLASPGDELYVLALHEGTELVGVLPLVRVQEKHYGIQVQVMRHIGIWEGDRPGILSLDGSERMWSAAWQFLCGRRADWQVLDLRELRQGNWLLRELRNPGKVFSSEARFDIEAPFQRLDCDWSMHVATRRDAVRVQRARAQQHLQARMPGVCVAVAEQPSDILVAFDQYLALEQALITAGPGVTVGSDPRRVAFYREWLPKLAARGDAAVWLLGGVTDEVAGLIRLRSGDVWIERHACYDPDYADCTPSLLLTVEALQRSFGTTAQECHLVNIREPEGAAVSVLDWFDGRDHTLRLSVRNLHSRLGALAVVRSLGHKIRGR